MIALALLAGALCAPVAPVASATRQLVTVEATTRTATHATVRLWRRSASGCWTAAGGPWPARIGRHGLSSDHREGDGTTPLGTFAFGRVAYGVARDPGVRLAYHRLVCGDWWNEDPSSPGYNRFRHVRCGTSPPFRGESEALWLATRAYRLFAVIRYNDDPVVRGRGSAIFLHADTGARTNGCVSLPLPQLVRVLRWLDPSSRPAIAIRVR
jgi:L,D-peptidoglycan transpeptidase YkuD (ErfK/YbiS/YcfS/YnhG family)